MRVRRMTTERDPGLRRIERDSFIACLTMAGMAFGMTHGQVDAPAGVLGGGALVWISYRGIKSGIDALADRATGGGTRIKAAIGLVKFFTRYAILAVAAYVIMARL